MNDLRSFTGKIWAARFQQRTVGCDMILLDAFWGSESWHRNGQHHSSFRIQHHQNLHNKNHTKNIINQQSLGFALAVFAIPSGSWSGLFIWNGWRYLPNITKVWYLKRGLLMGEYHLMSWYYRLLGEHRPLSTNGIFTRRTGAAVVLQQRKCCSASGLPGKQQRVSEWSAGGLLKSWLERQQRTGRCNKNCWAQGALFLERALWSSTHNLFTMSQFIFSDLSPRVFLGYVESTHHDAISLSSFLVFVKVSWFDSVFEDQTPKRRVEGASWVNTTCHSKWVVMGGCTLINRA